MPRPQCKVYEHRSFRKKKNLVTIYQPWIKTSSNLYFLNRCWFYRKLPHAPTCTSIFSQDVELQTSYRFTLPGFRWNNLPPCQNQKTGVNMRDAKISWNCGFSIYNVKTTLQNTIATTDTLEHIRSVSFFVCFSSFNIFSCLFSCLFFFSDKNYANDRDCWIWHHLGVGTVLSLNINTRLDYLV